MKLLTAEPDAMTADLGSGALSRHIASLFCRAPCPTKAKGATPRNRVLGLARLAGPISERRDPA